MSRHVLKRCRDAVLRDPETLGDLLRDPRSLHLILHEARLTQKVLLAPDAIARIVQEPSFLVTLSDSEHLLDYLRRHQHLINRLMDDDELIAMVARDTRFTDYLLRDSTTLGELLDDERTLHQFARSKSRMLRLAGHRDFARLLSEEPEVLSKLLEYAPLQEFMASHPRLLAASGRTPRGSQKLREVLLGDPESLEWVASDDRVLRCVLEQPQILDRILQSDRARTRIRASRKFLDQLIDDPGFIAELFLDSRVVKKLLNNRMLLRGLLQDESIQTAFLECMPTAPAAPLLDASRAGDLSEPDDSNSLAELLRSPEIATAFAEDDALLGCLLEDSTLCRRIAEHPILLRTLDEMGEPREPAPGSDPKRPPGIARPETHRRDVCDGEEFVFSFELDEPARARSELIHYWNEFVPYLEPTHTDFLTRFQHALNQLVSRDQISDTLVQILNDEGQVHLRAGSFNLLAGSKLPDLLFQVLVAGRYRFDASTDTPRILDCGSQAGLATFGFKAQYPGARITTVEPAPSLRQAARANLKAAGHEDIEHLAYALATERGSLPFVLAADGNHGGILARDGVKTAGAAKTLSVRGRRLGDLLRDPVDFLKLDVAGAELDILLDAEPELVNVKQLFVEVHDVDTDFPERLTRLFSVLKRSGFTTRVVPQASPVHAPPDDRARTGSQNGFEVFGLSARRVD